MSTPSEPPKCRWRLDNTTSATVVLPDGRELGYAEYGAPQGQPVFYLHGFPGSRIEATFMDEAASKKGARIIAVDRPGFGWSAPHKDRTLLSHARDIEELSKHLKLPKYGVLGISGGGPYALACAHACPPKKLRGVSIVCGLGSPDMGYWGMKWPNWAGWTFGQRLFPGLCRWWFSREPGARLDLSYDERLKLLRQGFEKDKAKMHPKDVGFFGDPDLMHMHLARSAEAFKQGMMGFSDDFRILNADFGFKIEDIRKDLPVQVWHGEHDVFVPLQHAQKVKARIGETARLTITDDTHASISALRQEEYLGDLVKLIEAE